MPLSQQARIAAVPHSRCAISDAAAKQHERALEALDAGAPPGGRRAARGGGGGGPRGSHVLRRTGQSGPAEPDDGTVGGSPPEVDLEGAAAAYAKAAELGCAPAAFNYAHCLRRGDGVPRDEKRAYDYYQQASDGDRAAFQLGLAADPLHGDVKQPGGAKGRRRGRRSLPASHGRRPLQSRLYGYVPRYFALGTPVARPAQNARGGPKSNRDRVLGARG